jgi:hypothetical protein
MQLLTWLDLKKKLLTWQLQTRSCSRLASTSPELQSMRPRPSLQTGGQRLYIGQASSQHTPWALADQDANDSGPRPLATTFLFSSDDSGETTDRKIVAPIFLGCSTNPFPFCLLSPSSRSGQFLQKLSEAEAGSEGRQRKPRINSQNCQDGRQSLAFASILSSP